MFQQIGLNVDYQAMDWGTVVQRRAKKDPPDKGGWSVFNTFWSGLDQFNPVGHVFLRGNGKSGMLGWPSCPGSRHCARNGSMPPTWRRRRSSPWRLQLQALSDVPYVPLGQFFGATAYRKESPAS